MMTFWSSSKSVIIVSSSISLCSLVSMVCRGICIVILWKLLFVGKCYLFLEGENGGSLREWVSRGWRGISHSVLFRMDVILSSPSLGCLFLAAKESMCSPHGTNCSTREKFALLRSRTNGPRFNHVICQWQSTICRRPLPYRWIQDLSFFIYQTAESVFSLQQAQRQRSFRPCTVPAADRKSIAKVFQISLILHRCCCQKQWWCSKSNVLSRWCRCVEIQSGFSLPESFQQGIMS